MTGNMEVWPFDFPISSVDLNGSVGGGGTGGWRQETGGHNMGTTCDSNSGGVVIRWSWNSSRFVALNLSVGGGRYRRMYGRWRHGMGGALAGHTLSFSRTSSPDCIHIRVLFCGDVEQGKVGVVGVTWVELGVASSCKGRASQTDSGVDVAGEKKVTLLHAQGGE